MNNDGLHSRDWVDFAGYVRHVTARRCLKRAVVSVLLMGLLVVGGCCTRSSPGPHDPLDTFTAHLDQRVPRLMDRYDVPGASLALVRDRDLVWSGAYGYADLERGRKMTTDAVFRAESISKSVTAWGVMRWVEEGRIDLDDPVQPYLGDGALADYVGDAVTVRHLLSQNAGMPLGPIGAGVEYAPQSERPSLRAYLTAEVRPVRDPGTGFLYSNVGFNLLELLVEEVTGRDFAAYMADAVLDPLGMHRSSFAWDETMRPLMPVGYEQQGTPVPPYVYSVRASGGLFATVDDIARFVSAEMMDSADRNASVLTPDSLRALHTPEVPTSGIYRFVADAYGLGHFIEMLPDGQQAVWHGGQGHGWMAHFLAVPASGDGIVILTNSERSWPLMAHLLSDWARWRGFGSVKMGRIVAATRAVWALISLVVLVSLWQGARLVQGLRSGTRRFAPLAGHSRWVRLLQAVLGLGVMGALAWSVAQPYLMMSSIFPGAVGWAGAALLAWAVVMVLSAAYPRSSEEI